MKRSCARGIALALAVLLAPPRRARAQETSLPPRGGFVGYEVSEMAMNGFRHFAGEAGIRLNRRHQIRLTVMEVVVSERDLAGWWSAAVDGEGVAGYLRAYELSADRFFHGNWYAGINAGYIANEFRHVTLDERIWHETVTAGVAVGYARANVFGVRRVHINFTMPARIYLDDIDETQLGQATVRAHRVVPNTWLFIGYWF